MYYDEDLGVLMVRGENVVLIGKLVRDRCAVRDGFCVTKVPQGLSSPVQDDAKAVPLREASPDDVHAAMDEDDEEAKRRSHPTAAESWEMGEHAS